MDDVPRLVVARIPEFDPTELALIVSALKGDVVPVSVLALTLLDLLHGAARIHFDKTGSQKRRFIAICFRRAPLPLVISAIAFAISKGPDLH